MDVKLREFKPEDLNLILTTWSKSYYQHLTEKPPKSIFFKNHTEHIKKILAESVCLVAVAHDDDSQIIGYSVYSDKGEKCLHYVYIKALFRGMQFSRLLLAPLGEMFLISHYTSDLKHLKHKYKMVFNPYRFYFEGQSCKSE